MHAPVELLFVSDIGYSIRQLDTNTDISPVQWNGVPHHNDPSEESRRLLPSM